MGLFSSRPTWYKNSETGEIVGWSVPGLVIAFDEDYLTLQTGSIFARKTTQVKYKDIISVTYSNGNALIDGRFFITTPGGNVVANLAGGYVGLEEIAKSIYEHRDKALSQTPKSIPFSDEKSHAFEHPQTTSNAQSRNSDSKATDMFEEIKKYKELLDLGIITQAEFDNKKAVLLGTIIPQEQNHNYTGTANESDMPLYCVILTDCGPDKMRVMVQLKSILNIEIIEARKMINDLPSTLARDVSLKRASYIKSQLEEAGATIKVLKSISVKTY